MDIYTTITERIIKQLEAGVVPWRKTWTTGLPKSLTTGKEYRGVNILALGLSDFTSRYWVTYRQAQRLGGQVRQGERASAVIYWKWRTPDELKRLAEDRSENPAPCFPFVSAVFNLDQVEGLARPVDDVPHQAHERYAIAEQMLSVTPNRPEIVHATAGEPSYNVALDRITLPHLSQFESGAEYYATLFHELTHSTGHFKRLNRFTGPEGDRMEKYSFEELVAEFGAAFLCGFSGISNEASEALQASYIENWLAVLRQDHRLVLCAASKAQHAVDFIRGKALAQELSVAA